MDLAGLFNKADKQQNPWVPKAEAAYEKGLYHEAAAHYTKAVELEPQNATSWLNLGTCMRMLQNYDRAAMAYNKVVEIDPENAAGWMNLSLLLGDSGKYEEAAAAVSHVILPESEAYLKERKCEWLTRCGKYEEAASVAKHLVSIFPENLQYKVQYAGLLMRSGSFAEAKKLYDELASAEGENKAVYLANAGFCAEMLGDADAAVKCYSDLSEDDATGWYRRALIEESRCNFKEAATAYNMVQFASSNPDDITVVIRRAFCLLWDGEGREAAVQLEKMISKGFASPELWYALGSVSFINGSLKRAAECFEEYIHLAGTVNASQYLKGASGAAVWYMKGCAEFELGKYAESIKSMKQLARASGSSPAKMKWFTDEGDFDLFDSQTPKADKPLEIGVVNQPLESLQAQSYLALGKFADADKSARAVLDLSPDRLDLEMVHARAMAGLGRFGPAAESAARILDAEPENAAALLELAEAKAALGQFAEADAAWKKLLELEPENARAQVQDVKCAIATANFSGAKESAETLLGGPMPADITLTLAAAESAAACGNYAEAAAHYKEAASIIPQIPECWLGLGSALEMQGEYPDAAQAYAKAAELLPNSPAVLVPLARTLESAGDKRQALSVYLNVVNTAPQTPGAAAATEKLAFDLGEYATAADAAGVAVANGDDSFDVSLIGGKSCAAIDRLDDAAAYYQAAQKIRPDNTEILLLLGQADLDKGAYDEAVQCAGIVLNREEDNIRALFIKGSACENTGHFAEAAKAYNRIVELEPENTKALLALANTYLQMQKYDDVLAVYGQYIDIEPANTDIIRKSTAIYILKGDYNEALAGYSLLLEANPEDLVTRRYKAEAEAYLGDYEASADTCAEVLARRPDDVAMRMMYARALVNSGRTEDALREYAEITLKEPENADALFGYADTLSRLGRYPEAIRYFGKMIEMYPRNSLAYLEKALCALKVGDPKATLAEFTQTAQADPKNPYVLSGLGFMHIATGHPNEALQLFDRADALGCTDLDLDYCRGLVQLQMCRFDLANRSADKVIAKEPEHAAAWHLKAKAMEGAGDLKQAIACFKKIEELEADSDDVAEPEGLFTRGEADVSDEAAAEPAEEDSDSFEPGSFGKESSTHDRHGAERSINGFVF